MGAAKPRQYINRGLTYTPLHTGLCTGDRQIPSSASEDAYKSWLEEGLVVRTHQFFVHFNTQSSVQHGNAELGTFLNSRSRMDIHLVLRRPIPLCYSPEAAHTSLPPWPKGFTYCRKCSRYSQQEPVANVLAMG
jgi:hypothetical protein